MLITANAESIFVPKTWDDVGLSLDPSAIDELRRLRYGRETIAILLHGEAGLGKTALARHIARSLACHGVCDQLEDPCGACPSCEQEWTSRRWTDSGIAEIDCTSGQPPEIIAKIERHTKYRSVFGVDKFNRTVIILDEVHRNHGVLSDRLLKMIEEPGGHVFILVTNKPEKLEDAVIQRCLDYELRIPDRQDAIVWLRGLLDRNGVEASDKTIAGIVDLANGNPRLIRTSVRRRMRITESWTVTINTEITEEVQS